MEKYKFNREGDDLTITYQDIHIKIDDLLFKEETGLMLDYTTNRDLTSDESDTVEGIIQDLVTKAIRNQIDLKEAV